MKNQYVGDIGDYGKYGLLRFLANKGIKIGVNWYLTKTDGTNDGKFIKYLGTDEKNSYPEIITKQYKRYDPELFEALKPIVAKGRDNKSVHDIENSGIIPNAVFYNEKLDDQDRTVWYSQSLDDFSDKSIDLIFADPDNGTLNPSQKPSKNNGEKYATVEELGEYYRKGKNVAYYCHIARRSKEKWDEKKNEFKSVCADAKIIVLTFHYGTQRSFIFAVHPENYDEYNKWINDFLKTKWGSLIINGKKNPPFTKE